MMNSATRPHRRRTRRLWLAFLGLGFALALVAAGCRDSGPGEEVFTQQGGEPSFRLAVLPFSSPANAPGAGAAVTSTIVTYLLSTHKVDVVEPGLVEKAMRLARYSPESSAGLDPDELAALQPLLQADAYMVGNVTDYGDVRVGPDTYPSVSFSARVIRASDDNIIWAASISRTGADSVKIFDIGRVSSMGKLTNAAVAELAASLRQNASKLASAAPAGPRPAVFVPTTAPKTAFLHPTFEDESRTFGVADLKALLLDVPGFSRGEVSHSHHFYDSVSALYGIDGGAIDATLTDYLKGDAAKQAVQERSAGLKEDKLDSMAAYSGTSAHSGDAQLNVVLGRFGLFLTGPSSAGEKMRQLAVAIAADGKGK